MNTEQSSVAEPEPSSEEEEEKFEEDKAEPVVEKVETNGQSDEVVA